MKDSAHAGTLSLLDALGKILHVGFILVSGFRV